MAQQIRRFSTTLVIANYSVASRSILLGLPPHERSMISRYSWYASPYSPLVVSVLRTEERNQSVFLHNNSLLEESETDDGVEEKADRVHQQNLQMNIFYQNLLASFLIRLEADCQSYKRR